MIFKIHYFFFNGGLSTTLMFLAVFLKRYTDCSQIELGILLMLLALFVVILQKIFCALARQQGRYRTYFVCSLILTALGFGSFIVLPLLPDEFTKYHGRTTWYILIGLTILGYTSYGVASCLGELLAINYCDKTGQSFRLIRLWGAFGLGISGVMIGLTSQYSIILSVPELMPNLFITLATITFDIGMLLLWPKSKDFQMIDWSLNVTDEQHAKSSSSPLPASPVIHHNCTNNNNNNNNKGRQHEQPWSYGNIICDRNFPFNDSVDDISTTIDNDRDRDSLAAAIVDATFNDTLGYRFGGDSLSSRYSVDSAQPRESSLQRSHSWNHDNPDNNNNSDAIREDVVTVKRTPSNSLVITIKNINNFKDVSATIHTASDNRANASDTGSGDEVVGSSSMSEADKKNRKYLQMIIFRMVALKHRSLIKYLIIFIIFGILFNINRTFFFLHLETLTTTTTNTEELSCDFFKLTGMCLIAQSAGETLCLILAPWMFDRLGGDIIITMTITSYAITNLCNGYLLTQISPYLAILTETLHAINYGIGCYLMADMAFHFTLMAEETLTDLYSLKLIDSKSDLTVMRNSFRSTVQCIFNCAFKGLGFGLGALLAGLYLETHQYDLLWRYTGFSTLIILAIHVTYEIISGFLTKREQSVREKLRLKLSVESDWSKCDTLPNK